jgi:hypothetical protein
LGARYYNVGFFFVTIEYLGGGTNKYNYLNTELVEQEKPLEKKGDIYF